MSVPRETHEKLEALGVPRETLPTLEAFVSLLGAWNTKINLVSSASERVIWDRHILDSLQLLPLIPENASQGVDIGSGAGFPGLLLCAVSNIPFDLIEADRRKAAFLGEAARVMQAPAIIQCVRMEACKYLSADLVTSRALAPLSRLLSLATPVMKTGGVALFHKGAQAEREVEEAALHWTMKVERFSSVTDTTGVLLRISELARA